MKRALDASSQRLLRLAPVRVAIACAFGFALGNAAPALAFQFGTDSTDLKVRWDNTIKYTAAWRVKDPDPNITVSLANPNVDFGDLSYNSGLINNRVDLLSELDVGYKNMGFRVSGAAWYDSVYNKDTTDYVGVIPNRISAVLGGPNNVLSQDAKDMMGKKGELLDAFVYGSVDMGEQKLTVRVGKHTLLYGESLFLGANAVAAAQGPVDLIKAFSLPNAQFKEIAMPVGQVSANLSISSNLSLGGYYQYQWKGLRVPASGSYFGIADFIGPGGDLLLSPAGPASRVADRNGDDSGQWGVQVKIKDGFIDYGLYAGRFHEKGPIPVLDFTVPGAFNAGVYSHVYAKDISFYGASVSTVVGETNLAAEISTRRNAPLSPVGDLIITTTPGWDNDRNTPYALGNTLHVNLSMINLLPATPMWAGASIVAELAYNRLLSVSRNPVNGLGISALNTLHTRD
ncbi:MAG: DUF1302 family protein [Proteobacteria bacterium]|nr:DUF1302 family protein [Pseudomonadota bacterium]